MKKWTLSLGVLFALPTMIFAQTRQWTLKDCIDYAMQHNISLQKQRVAVKSAEEEVLHSKAELLPSVSASTSQNVTIVRGLKQERPVWQMALYNRV